MLTRRELLQVAATGGWLRPRLASHVVLIQMAGGPSHTDTFDCKQGPWTPPGFAPMGRLRFPQGLMPRVAGLLDEVVLVRSLEASSTDHRTATAWMDRWMKSTPLVRASAASFRDACDCARRQVSMGARIVRLRLGGWDHHGNIYQQLRFMAGHFDAGVASLIAGLKRDGTLSSTLIVAMGEFGRRPGPLNQNLGRDHHTVHSALIAGAGIRGGRAIGRTDETGEKILDTGWSETGPIRAENIIATLDYALGREGPGQPVHELWN